MRIPNVLAVLATLAAVTAGRAEEPPELERVLVRQAPALIKHFKAKGYANVGVLKFAVSKDGKSLSDNVGTLNMTLADRLEVALVVGNDPRRPVGVVRNASAVAARTAGANHRHPDGRAALFTARYPLAWGKTEVTPDAFVTGVAQVSADLKTVTLGFACFDRSSKELEWVGGNAVARNRPDELAEMGESFVLRGGIQDVGGAAAQAVRLAGAAFQSATSVRSRAAKHPLQDNPPVGLEVRYDGSPVPVEFRDGRAFVAEPREGQRVEFVLGRNATKERYGAVLKVNGENTLERQTKPDARCRMWVIEPGKGPYTIVGFQKGGNTAEAFRVLSPKASAEREMNYGKDVGTVTLTVFREQSGEPKPPDLSDETADAEVVQNVELPADPPANFDALKASLEAEGSRSRGLVVEGAEVENRVVVVPFKPDPTPVMAATVVYYKR